MVSLPKRNTAQRSWLESRKTSRSLTRYTEQRCGRLTSFDGHFVSFANVTANPKPAQTDLHTVVGGHSTKAQQRAVSSCHGWYGFNRSPAAAAEDVLALRQAADVVDRPAALGREFVEQHQPAHFI